MISYKMKKYPFQVSKRKNLHLKNKTQFLIKVKLFLKHTLKL